MSLSTNTVISYSEALYDWVEANWDELVKDYKLKYNEEPVEGSWEWSDFCQERFDNMLGCVEDHDPLEDR